MSGPGRRGSLIGRVALSAGSVSVPTMRVSQALPLAVDPIGHAKELARFDAQVVRGPEVNDCWIFTGPIGGDGYGRYWIRRGGNERIMLRANRYALAVSLRGELLQPWERALHGCDNPICVRVSVAGEVGLLHLTGGSQRENMERMGRRGRGGGRRPIRRGQGGLLERRERSVALRAAVRTDGSRMRCTMRCAAFRIRRCGECLVLGLCRMPGREPMTAPPRGAGCDRLGRPGW